MKTKDEDKDEVEDEVRDADGRDIQDDLLKLKMKIEMYVDQDEQTMMKMKTKVEVKDEDGDADGKDIQDDLLKQFGIYW